MKAEHRKELQTNLLADRMGRVLQNVKTRPNRQVVFYVVLALVVVVVLLGVYFWRWSATNRNSIGWVAFESATNEKVMREIAEEYSSTPQGQSARMQIAWLHLWENGIKGVMFNPNAALNNIVLAKKEYEALAEDCKDDPILYSEALYCIAVAEESLACNFKDVQGAQLDKALTAYKAVVDNLKDKKTAFVLKAEKRIEELENPAERKRIDQFYANIRSEVGLHMLAHQPFLDPSKKKR